MVLVDIISMSLIYSAVAVLIDSTVEMIHFLRTTFISHHDFDDRFETIGCCFARPKKIVVEHSVECLSQMTLLSNIYMVSETVVLVHNIAIKST